MSVARIAFVVLLALGPTAAPAAGEQGANPATALGDNPAGAAVHRAETAFLDTAAFDAFLREDESRWQKFVGALKAK